MWVWVCECTCIFYVSFAHLIALSLFLSRLYILQKPFSYVYTNSKRVRYIPKSVRLSSSKKKSAQIERDFFSPEPPHKMRWRVCVKERGRVYSKYYTLDCMYLFVARFEYTHLKQMKWYTLETVCRFRVFGRSIAARLSLFHNRFQRVFSLFSAIRFRCRIFFSLLSVTFATHFHHHHHLTSRILVVLFLFWLILLHLIHSHGHTHSFIRWFVCSNFVYCCGSWSV